MVDRSVKEARDSGEAAVGVEGEAHAAAGVVVQLMELLP